VYHLFAINCCAPLLHCANSSGPGMKLSRQATFLLIPLAENQLALFAYANTLVLQHSMPRMTFKASSTMFILYVDKRENQQQCSMIDVIVIADACLLILLIQKFLQKNWYLFEK